jgi:hypothetical protein
MSTFKRVLGNLTIQTVTASDVITLQGGTVTVTGNLTVSGTTTLAGNLSATSLASGTTNLGIPSVSGNANISVGGTSNVAVFTSTGANITGTANISGAITTASSVSATGNITGGNLNTSGIFSVGGNVQGGNLRTGGLISATGNITGGNVLGGANVNATTHTGTTVSVSGNIDGGNLRTGGLISATANVTGGNLLTGGAISATGNITGANLAVGTTTPDCEVTILATPQTAVYSITGNSTVTGVDLHISGADGSNTRILQDAFGASSYSAFTGRSAGGVGTAPTQTISGAILTQFTARGFSNGTLQFGNSSTGRVDIVAAENFTDTSRATNIQINTTASGAITPTVIATFSSASGLSVAGNVTGGNLLASGLINAVGNVTGGNIVANSDVQAGNLKTTGLISATGNITGGNVLGGANVNATSLTGTTVSITGNVISNNIQASNSITALNATVSTQLVIPFFSSDPISAESGSLYYSTALGVLRFYNGVAWVTV